jgi:SynChlorMet cassette protein ScmC
MSRGFRISGAPEKEGRRERIERAFQDGAMSVINHNEAYFLPLSDGRAWTIAPCRGADAWVRDWVSGFASHLGLENSTGSSARGLYFGWAREESCDAIDTFSRFVPPLPPEFPAEGWKSWGRSGAVFMWHPEIRDVFCGLYRSREPGIERMRRALLPIIEESIAAGGLPIHGALVSHNGRGVLLTGRSGAGNSTCCRRLPSGWQVLGDDLALVVQRAGGGYSAHPLPTWSALEVGEVRWPCKVNCSVPLQASFLLQQSPEDGIEPMDKASAVGFILQTCEEALARQHLLHGENGATLRRSIFDNALKLAKGMSFYRLRVSLGGRFWEKIEEILGAIGGDYD